MKPATPDTRPPITTTYEAGQQLRSLAAGIDLWKALQQPGVAEVEERLTGTDERAAELAETLTTLREQAWALISHLEAADARRIGRATPAE